MQPLRGRVIRQPYYITHILSGLCTKFNIDNLVYFGKRKGSIALQANKEELIIMEYSKTYVAKDEHIDVQEIMDGLYYPFYMEYCRHDYIREILGFDFETEAKNGIYMVLSNYSISFLRSLKKRDEFKVTCALYTDKG